MQTLINTYPDIEMSTQRHRHLVFAFSLPVHRSSLDTSGSRRADSSPLCRLAVFADVTGDGLTDLVMANKKSGDGATGPHISIQTGVGDGTFVLR